MILKDLTTRSPESALLQLAHLPYLFQSLYAATKLNVADVLVAGPQSSQEIAQAVGADAPSLFRVLRALAGIGIFAEDDQGRFALTPFAERLRTDTPDSIHALILWMCDPWRWEIIGDTLDTVRTGKTWYERTHQKDLYGFLRDNPQAGEEFNRGVKAWSLYMHQAAVAAYDFSGITTLVDVGGGMGNLIVSILQKTPTLQGISFDQPAVAEAAKHHISSSDVADRCQVIQGNFFEAVPQGGDAYLISFVLMDWDDDHVLQILQNCHRAMAPGNRLLIVEALIGAQNEPTFGKVLDLLEISETPSGRVRTAEEHNALLDKAGFKMTRVVSSEIPSVCVVEAERQA